MAELIKPSLLFFGSGRFSRICFQHLLEHGDGFFGQIGVVTPPGKSELSTFSHSSGHHCIQAPPKSLRGWLPQGCWDFGAVASFSYFLPSLLIDSFRIGIINAHPSLLPAYRGAAPIQRSMIDCAPKGISVIDLDKRSFDAGKIYYQKSVEIGCKFPYEKVEEALAAECGKALAKVFQSWPEMSSKANEQCGAIKLAPKITVKDAEIRIKTDSASDVYQRYLAIGHQENIRILLEPKQRQVHLLDIVDPDLAPLELAEATGLEPGSVYLERRRPKVIVWIRAADGNWIGAQGFRVEGKSNTFDAASFYSGFGLKNYAQCFS